MLFGGSSDPMTSSPLFAPIVLWIVFAILVVAVRTRTHQMSVGLVMAYLANLWLIHWPAALTYLFPWFEPPDIAEVTAGFQQSFYAVIGLTIGILIVAPVLTKTLEPPRSHTVEAERRLPDARLPYIYVLVGIFSYLVATPILGRIPTVSAIASGTNQFIVVGFCLLLWHFWFTDRKRQFVMVLLAACLIPLITILREGFLSYGAAALITIISFMTVFLRPRALLAAVLVISAYLGFSFYVTYMRDRADLRASVWGGESAVERVSNLSSSISTIEWFNPQDPDHVMRVNARLNQNYLVGAAVKNLETGSTQHAYGQTVFQALQALVPRALWPDKPVSAGSPRIVTEYTGITFAEYTSVGVGQVMEFYINFGTAGVVIGFILFGTVLAMLDTWAAQRLWAGDWLQFAVWFLPGLALMQAGGSLVEVLSTAGAGVMGVLLVNRFVVRARLGPPRTAGPIRVHT